MPLLVYVTGYEGRYTNKMGKVKEGSATFWRTSRLSEVSRKDVLLRDVFKEVSRFAYSGESLELISFVPAGIGL